MSPKESDTAGNTLSKSAMGSGSTWSRPEESRLLSAFAEKLVKATNNSGVQSFLLQAISSSDSKEKIVPLKSLLMSNNFAQAVAVSPVFIDGINGHPLGIDVYFPAPEHRQSMLQNPQQDFLVTYFDGYQDDQVERQFPAWDRSGNKIMLTTAAPPETPVLVITQCEHGGNHLVVTPQVGCGEPDCGGGGGGGSSSPGVTLYFNWYTLHDANESWPAGTPEIYFKTWLFANGQTKVQEFRQDHYWMRAKNEEVEKKFLVGYSASDAWAINSAKIEVWESDSGPDDEVERYGGWRKYSGAGTWYQYNSLDGTPTQWYGDDLECDLRIFLEYY